MRTLPEICEFCRREMQALERVIVLLTGEEKRVAEHVLELPDGVVGLEALEASLRSRQSLLDECSTQRQGGPGFRPVPLLAGFFSDSYMSRSISVFFASYSCSVTSCSSSSPFNRRNLC